ncbi:MYB-like DNA-binding domain protein [Hibiscus syriacus]|uniref:MYB-like DNA-binding domain protein n=1 Tax=Hibiscus syriacus TaxID=106335 RepID=A0A6A3A1P7_HIBSY|nr:MYB-like DNA-binding domain protein [Hibiscus syriacus]
MLKCRFRVPVYHLFTGYSGFVSARKTALPITWQSKGFESLKRSLHTSTDDDDFAELGLPEERVGGIIRKLKTGKPEHFVKIGGAEKKLNGSHFKADSHLNIKDVSHKVAKSSVPSLDLQNNNDEKSNFRTSHSVTIKNVPSIIDCLKLKKTISVFGKVSKFSKRSVPNGLDCCDIEFKLEKSRKEALSMGYVTVKEVSLLIWPLQSSETVIIRIRNISLETAESAIHFTCKSCGLFEGLVKLKEDVVDASFRVNGETDTKTILKKLNSIVMDESKWSARLQDGESPSMAMTENGNAEDDDLAFKIGGHFTYWEREIRMKKICVNDLQLLHHSLLHLEDHPLKADASFPPSKESEL